MKHHNIRIRAPQWYGCRRDTRDARDHLFVPALSGDELAASLPAAVDLREHFPGVLDQGQLGSCVAHGVSCALRYYAKLEGGPRDHRLARLQMYYDARVLEGTADEDSGCEIRDAIKCAAKIGSAHETMWPYVIVRFAKKPTTHVYDDAMKFEALEYQRVTVDTAHVKAALASGFPVIVGLSLYESFEYQEVTLSGIVPMPNLAREDMIGGHCMCVAGYGQRPGYFTVRNSWGTSWGDNGDCYMPEAYIGSAKFGADYWIIRKAGKPAAA